MILNINNMLIKLASRTVGIDASLTSILSIVVL